MREINIPIGQMFGQFGQTEDQPRPLHEAQIMELQGAFEAFDKGCPFKPGDLVTPRTNSPYTHAGEPHIVLEVADQPFRILGNDVQETSNTKFGSRLDVRVAIVEDGMIIPFWQESWQLEAYVPKA